MDLLTNCGYSLNNMLYYISNIKESDADRSRHDSFVKYKGCTGAVHCFGAETRSCGPV